MRERNPDEPDRASKNETFWIHVQRIKLPRFNSFAAFAFTTDTSGAGQAAASILINGVHACLKPFPGKALLRIFNWAVGK